METKRKKCLVRLLLESELAIVLVTALSLCDRVQVRQIHDVTLQPRLYTHMRTDVRLSVHVRACVRACVHMRVRVHMHVCIVPCAHGL